MAYISHSTLGVSPFVLALAALVGVLWTANSGEALSCVNCEFKECSTKPLKCPYGITKDVCGCCDICANGVGEECGGENGMLGRCGKGLRCDPRPRGNEALPIEITEGICVQYATPTPPRRVTAVPTKWKKIGEECGGRRWAFGKCVKGLRCDRSPRGNAATPIIWRKGVCVPVTSNADPDKTERRNPGSRTERPDSVIDKASKKTRTPPPNLWSKDEADNQLNPLYETKEVPLWFVRASWLERRQEAIKRDRQESMKARGLGKDTRRDDLRSEDQRRPSRGEGKSSGLRYF